MWRKSIDESSKPGRGRPTGAQFAASLGDRSNPGAPYVFRARLPDGYRAAPHWHPMDENVTVSSGVFRVPFTNALNRR